MKQVIRLTEGDLHRIVKESVRKILKEYGEGEGSQEKLGTAYMMAIDGVHSMYDERMKRAENIAKYAAKKRKEHGIPVDHFVKGMNKVRKK